MDEYLLFEAFERDDYIPWEQIKKITNYISDQLISWSPNRSYYEAQYNYATKLYIVSDWKKTKGIKKGEAICINQLANFFKDAKHKNCSCTVV